MLIEDKTEEKIEESGSSVHTVASTVPCFAVGERIKDEC